MFITRTSPHFLFNQDEGAGAGQAPTEGTPDADQQAGTEQQPTQAEIDWQKRYSDLQPEYTRATQEAAQLRRQAELYQTLLHADDPDTRRQAAEALGIELADDDYDDDTQDTPYLTREEWAQYQAQMRDAQKAAQQQDQEAQHVQWLESYVDDQLQKLGVDEDDADWIVQRAISMPTQTPDGVAVPDIQGAFEALKARDLARQKKWAQTKRTHQFSPVGEEGTQALPRNTHEQRVARAMARLQADQ